jgi:hypothetical protein
MPDGYPTQTHCGRGHCELDVHVSESPVKVREYKFQVVHPLDGRDTVYCPICRIKKEKVWDGLSKASMEGDEGWEFIGEEVDRDSVLEEGVNLNFKIVREMLNYQLPCWFSYY